METCHEIAACRRQAAEVLLNKADLTGRVSIFTEAGHVGCRVKRKAKRKMKDAKPATQGTSYICGTKLFGLGKS